jgi:hypothetical protein
MGKLDEKFIRETIEYVKKTLSKVGV